MKSLKISLLCIALLVAVIYATCGLIPKSPYLAGIAILEFGVLLYGIFWWFVRGNVYQCAHCEAYFSLSAISNMMAIKALDTRLAKCPACGVSDYDRAFSRKEIEENIIEPGMVKAHIDGNWTGFYIQIAITSLFYIVFVVLFIVFWYTAKGILNLSAQTLLDIQRGLLAELSAISALYALYLAVFISAIRQKYKTGIYLAMSVILTVSIVLIFLIEYSHLKYLLEITDNLASF